MRKIKFIVQSWDPSSPTLAAPHRAPNLHGESKWQAAPKRNATQPAGFSSREIKGRLLGCIHSCLEDGITSRAAACLQALCAQLQTDAPERRGRADSPGRLGGHSLSEHVPDPPGSLVLSSLRGLSHGMGCQPCFRLCLFLAVPSLPCRAAVAGWPAPHAGGKALL